MPGNASGAPASPYRPPPVKEMTATRALAFRLIRDCVAIEDVMHQTGIARSTVVDYLCDFIRQEKLVRIDTWIAPDLYDRIAAAVREHGSARLKPLFLALQEKVSYDEIRIVVAHLNRDQ